MKNDYDFQLDIDNMYSKELGEGMYEKNSQEIVNFLENNNYSQEQLSKAWDITHEPKNKEMLEKIVKGKEEEKQNNTPSKDETDLDDEER